MFIASYVFSLFENVPDYARIIVFVFIFLLYDPLFTSIFGGTIGHMIIGIRVKRESNIQKNILFPLAILRFIMKNKKKKKKKKKKKLKGNRMNRKIYYFH